MSIEELEKRLSVLEDLDCIKRLKARYAQVLDGFSGESIENLFTEDGIWDVGEKGLYKGRKAIAEFFQKIPEFQPFSVHYFVQPEIEIVDKKAKGRWYMWLPATRSNNRAVWSAGIEDDEYEKVNGIWLISKLKLTNSFRTPYEEGWHKRQFI